MNKTININIGGTFFHIDEEAYDELQHYLVILKKSFHSTAGKEEIISDIEYRIAELFSERLTEMRQVINRKDVDTVIEIMGRPEEFKEEADEESSFTSSGDSKESFTKSSNTKTEKTSRKKEIFRDPETAIFGGVLAGFAHYINFDKTWIRIIWILLSFTTLGTFILIYLILWAVIPEPKNTSDRLKMKGERINISNIEKTIKNEFENLEKGVGEFSDKVKNTDFNKMGNQVKSNAQRIIDKIVPVIKGFFRLIAKFIGIIILIFTSMSALFLLFGWFVAGILGFGDMYFFSDIEMMNETDLPLWLVTTLLFIITIIPTVLFMILGLKLTINKSTTSYRNLGLSLLGVWIITALISTFFIFQQSISFQSEGSKTMKEVLEIPASEPFVLSINPENKYEDLVEQRFEHTIVHLNDNVKKIMDNDINIELKQGTSSQIEVKTKRLANGYNMESAKKRAENIEYFYQQVDNNIIFDNYYLHPIEDKMRGQEMNITILIPENSTFKISKNMRRFIDTRLDNDMDFRDYNLSNHTWKLTNGMLNCVDCEKEKTDIQRITNTSDEELGTQASDTLSEDYNF